ncbi:MAG: hypothetical protein MJZ20_01520 [Bacteroidaceae bacterium]|nr:hypothetical protein [Bacteroidaceae bacterium]
MAKLVWDQVGERLFETGIKNVALYVQDNSGAYPLGVEWNGITAITESPSGAETTTLWADDQKYLNLISTEELGLSIEAYMYPEAFNECDGLKELTDGAFVGQQSRKAFGLAYKTTLGNDISNTGYGYKLHIIYGCLASPSQKGYSTVNDSPDAISFSWDVKTTPVPMTEAGFKSTASITIDSTAYTGSSAANLQALEDQLFGKDADETAGTAAIVPHLLLPAQVKQILTTGSLTTI